MAGIRCGMQIHTMHDLRYCDGIHHRNYRKQMAASDRSGIIADHAVSAVWADLSRLCIDFVRDFYVLSVFILAGYPLYLLYGEEKPRISDLVMSEEKKSKLSSLPGKISDYNEMSG
ncbi:MAG: hypothetical protein ACLUUO_15425 [Sellimonas intestinalis]